MGEVMEGLGEVIGEVDRDHATRNGASQLCLKKDRRNVTLLRTRGRKEGMVKLLPGSVKLLLGLRRRSGRIPDRGVQGADLETEGGKRTRVETGVGAIFAGIVVAGLAAAAARRKRNFRF